MKKLLFSTPTPSPTRLNVALLALRLVAGAALVLHGWPKIQNPFGWMGPDASIPGPLLALAALSEFGGGLAWILGLLMPLASAGILVTMVVAVYQHMIVRGDPFVSMGASYEPALLFFAVALSFLLAGPGAFSIDALIKTGSARQAPEKERQDP